MKKVIFLLSFVLTIGISKTSAQYSGNFVVQGDSLKYYPVVFQDLSWSSNKAPTFDLGRSSVHTDVLWRGSMIARFRLHTTDWGNGSQFIEANLHEYDSFGVTNFVGGWVDATSGNTGSLMIIWLKGGSTTYYFNAETNIAPVVYDGVAHALPYAEPNGPSRTYKTAVDWYVNPYGESFGSSAYYISTHNSFFGGNVGIGAPVPTTKLSVNSNATAPTTPDLTNSIVVGAVGANASNKYLGQLGFLSADADFTTPKMVAYISGEAAEVYSSDADVASRMRFYTGAVNGTSPVERMVIDESGNLGIGTATSDARLAVNGTIHSKSILVDNNFTPDYVFNKTYALRPPLPFRREYVASAFRGGVLVPRV